MPQPTEFKLLEKRDLRVTWNDGHTTRFSLQRFRDECPCAGCQGESDIFGEIKMPMQLPIAIPGKYELKSLTPVGNYAVAARWGDGHDTGIYSWHHLLAMEARMDQQGNTATQETTTTPDTAPPSHTPPSGGHNPPPDSPHPKDNSASDTKSPTDNDV